MSDQPMQTNQALGQSARSAFVDRARASKVGWVLMTCPWQNVDGYEGRYLAVNVESSIEADVVHYAQKQGLEIQSKPNGDGISLLSIHGNENISQFQEIRQRAQARLLTIVGNAGWDDVLLFDNASDDIAFANSKGIETGVVISNWAPEDKERLVRALGMLDISYAIGSSAGKEAVFVVDDERLNTVIQNAIAPSASVDKTRRFNN